MEFYFFEQSRNEVKCRGDALDIILWQGSQWAVTAYGLEKRDGTYPVDRNNFFTNVYKFNHIKNKKEAVFNEWLAHLSEKSWCDKDDLWNALNAMCLLFDEKGNRTSVAAPTLCNLDDIEHIASEAANKAYEETKRKAMLGLL